jgi:DNA-binding CsgD family transcriptional regulator
MSPSEEQNLIEKIYEAASFPVRWVEVLGDLEKLAGAAASGLFSIDLASRSDEVSYIATPSAVASMHELLNTEWRFKNNRPALAMTKESPRFRTTYDLISEKDMETDEFRLGFLIPRGLDEELGTIIVAPDGKAVVVSLVRRHGAPRYARETVDMFTRIRPHLARSMMLATRAGLRQSEITTQLLSALGVPAVVLTGGGTVVAANESFPFDSVYFTTDAKDRLTPLVSASERLLREAIADSLMDRSSTPKSFPIFGLEESQPYIADLLPMPGDAQDLFSRARFVLILTKLATPTPPPVSVLRALYDLTPTEADIARALAYGDTVGAISNERERSRETIRAQLKTIFDKTGTSRQTELVSLLLGRAVQIKD